MIMALRTHTVICRLIPLLALAALVATVSSAFATAGPRKQKSFATPDDAVAALVAAVGNNDVRRLKLILGPGSGVLISSGDPVADSTDRTRFVSAYEERNRIELSDPQKALLVYGDKEYPFPIPLIRQDTGWVFDTRAGREEVLNRRIGSNELRAIEVVRAYVIAQREYATGDRNSDSILEFAQKLASTPGKKDGLYWEVKEGEQESPFGPLTARAASEGYKTSEGVTYEPFHGYYFKILKGQGAHAEGGAYDYVVNGNMVLGFALVAYPARYGASGIMTFIVNQSGIVYQKNLGRNSAAIARSMTAYNPDHSWKKIE